MDRHPSGGRSFRPPVVRDLKRIRDELSHCARNGWTVGIEHQTQPSFSDPLWHQWGTPVCESVTGTQALHDLARCCETHPDHFVRLSAYQDQSAGGQIKLRILVRSPGDEMGELAKFTGVSTNTAIEAVIYNSARVALRKYGEPLNLTLEADLHMLEIALARSRWDCTDKRASLRLITWSDFDRPEPVSLHQPVRCRQVFAHQAAGRIVGKVLEQLRTCLDRLD